MMYPDRLMNNKTWFHLLSLLLKSCWDVADLPSVVQPVSAGITPAACTNLVGSSLTLSVSANVPLPYDYQWSKDGIPLVDDSQVSGSVTPTLTISDLQFTNTGTYSVSLSYTGVVQTTAASAVYVVDQPIIESVVPLASGGSISFIATATGGLLSYQWTWQGQPIPGATSSALVFPDAYADASAGFYTVIVTNPLGVTTWSGPSFLFTKPTPSGTYQGI